MKKIKIDKRIWLIVGVVVIIVALVLLARTYTQQVNEQKQLKTSLAAQQTLLRQLTTQESDQQNKLNAAESLLETSRVKFPESVESIEYGEDLFIIADHCNVELTSLSPSMPGIRTAGAVTYSFSSFAITVQGDVTNILDFINALRTGEGFRQAWSADVTSVSIDFGGAGEVANIGVDIYGYRG
jgi:type II secretory pathway pseudopilin PulG